MALVVARPAFAPGSSVRTGLVLTFVLPGAVTNPHGVKGLEHCRFLKSINDAYLIRNHVINNLEQASLPTTSDEERKRLLSFVVSGGGPTGMAHILIVTTLFT